MGYYDTNLAYDYLGYGVRTPEAEAPVRRERPAAPVPAPAEDPFRPRLSFRQRLSMVTRRDPEYSRALIAKVAKVFLACAAAAVLLGTIVYNQAKLNELTGRVAETRRQISVLEEEYRQKSVALEKQIDVRRAEDLARNQYGMVPAEDSQINYVTLRDGSGEAGLRSESGLAASVGRFAERVFAYISGD